jgi:hypothetical protein
MSYTIYKTNGLQLLTLLDGTLDDKYGVKLVGKNYINYGTAQNENFIYLLENFASDIAPLYPLAGQLWYNTTANTINCYDGVSFSALANVNQLSGGVTSLNLALLANVALLHTAIQSNANIHIANAAVQATAISSLLANAVVQNDLINTINANVSTVNSNISTLQTLNTTLSDAIVSTNANVSATRGNISVLQGNVVALFANAAARYAEITAIQTAGYITLTNLAPYATLANPILTGTPQAITTALSDNSTKIATTAFVTQKETILRSYTDSSISSVTDSLNNNLIPAINLRANINSPAFTGTVQAPTVSFTDTSTAVATTAWVRNATQYWDGSRKYVSTNAPSASDGSNGDIWFQYQ